jgi:hypothetical protein
MEAVSGVCARKAKPQKSAKQSAEEYREHE